MHFLKKFATGDWRVIIDYPMVLSSDMNCILELLLLFFFFRQVDYVVWYNLRFVALSKIY